jgi:hypothetical protein
MASVRKNKFLELALGDPEKVPLEHRVIHAIWLQVIVCVIILTATNIVLNNPPDQVIGALTAFFIACISYVLSRFVKVYLFSNVFGIIGFLLMIACFWFGSGGIVGSWPYSLFILVVATVIVGPKRYKISLIVLEFSVCIALCLVEYNHPEWVVHYHSSTQQFIDMATYLVMCLLIISTIVHIVVLQYVREKEGRERLLAQVIKDKEDIEKAFSEIKQLQGIIPICAACKRVRNDSGYWEQVEQYIHEHSDARFSHGMCPDCIKKIYNKELPVSLQDSPR